MAIHDFAQVRRIIIAFAGDLRSVLDSQSLCALSTRQFAETQAMQKTASSEQLPPSTSTTQHGDPHTRHLPSSFAISTELRMRGDARRERSCWLQQTVVLD